MSDCCTLAMIHAVMAVPDEAAMRDKMRACAHALGFDHVLFGLQLNLPLMGPRQHITSAYPEAYQRLYLAQRFIESDPTVTHCQNRNDPLVWIDSMYTPASFALMEESRHHGLGHGISIPVHQGKRAVSMLSLARDRPIASPVEKEEVLRASHILASCLHVTAESIIAPQLLAALTPHFTSRELECFQWVAHGKSNWEIGNILSISEETVKFHMKSVLRKLNVSSRMQAVAIGVALGLLE